MTWARLSTLQSILACLAAGLFCSCADYEPVVDPTATEEEEDTTMFKGPPPWAMWGDTKSVRVEVGTIVLNVASSQICRIAYGRPETWDFFFSAKLIELTEDYAHHIGQIDVSFDVTIGVGRSSVTIQDFEHFIWYASSGSPITHFVPGSLKYSTEVIGPAREDKVLSTDPDGPENIIAEITAQDIQVGARLTYNGWPVGDLTPRSALVEVTAYFAPRVHLRPEWFKGEFPGGEDNGK